LAEKCKKSILFLNFLVLLQSPILTEKDKIITDMTKAEVVNKIAHKTGIEKIAIMTIVEEFMNTVKGSLTDGENVYLRGFGSFIVRKRAEKTGRNISKNTTVIIPAHNIPAFKPAKSFMAEVKNNTK
jgi:DNA-binding protein HU-beta